MSYGFACSNDSGEIVIDSSFKVYQIFDDTTVSGTFDATYNLYFYPADNDSLVFFNIPVGGYVGKTHTGEFISNESSLTFRYLRTASEIVSTDAYGLKVFDAFGEATYSSGAAIESIKETYRKGTIFYWTGGSGFDTFPSTITFDPTYSENLSDDWYAITAPVSSTFGSRWQTSVVFRETSSVVHGVMRPYASAPNNVLAPEPFWFLTA
jgi:hypothetical protein